MSIFGRKQHFSNLNFSVFEPFYLLFTSKLGNLICQGRPWAAKKVKNSHQNIIKVAKTPYFITYLGFSPGSICRFCLKVVQMCSFACPSTSRNQFGCLISAGLRPKKTALCVRPSVGCPLRRRRVGCLRRTPQQKLRPLCSLCCDRDRSYVAAPNPNLSSQSPSSTNK